MIGSLRGTVSKLRQGFILLDVDGVGYKVAVLKELLSRTQEGTEVTLLTHLAVREDSLDLYGFVHEEELTLFELLLTVSGIGPKSALAVLDLAAVETLLGAIANGNAAYLTNVSGVGKKTAEKIVLELKDKVESQTGNRAMSGDQEALEALRSLGYSAAEARDALRKVPDSVESGSARLKEALRILGKK